MTLGANNNCCFCYGDKWSVGGWSVGRMSFSGKLGPLRCWLYCWSARIECHWWVEKWGPFAANWSLFTTPLVPPLPSPYFVLCHALPHSASIVCTSIAFIYGKGVAAMSTTHAPAAVATTEVYCTAMDQNWPADNFQMTICECGTERSVGGLCCG